MKLVFVVLCGLAAICAAQSPTARVTGRVTDPAGAVVPGVAIKITNLDTNISQPAASNAVGDYTVPYLNPGRYTLEATFAGFRAYKLAEFRLAVDQELRL